MTDFGSMEVSPDNGKIWIDLMKDTLYSSYYKWDPKPILSGNSNGWQYFSISIDSLGNLFKVQFNDTILYRISFISDSIQTNKDGLMFDDFRFIDNYSGIDKRQNDYLISVFPNPTADILFVDRTKINDKESLEVYDFTGKLVIQVPVFIGETIDTKGIKDVVYIFKYTITDNYSIKMFIIRHY